MTKQFKLALARLDETMAQPKSEIVRDAALKRFEFTFDLAWKRLRAFLGDQKGIVCDSPKESFREGFRQGLLADDDLWIRMTDWRNRIVHEYSEDFARELYEKLPELVQAFRQLEGSLGA